MQQKRREAHIPGATNRRPPEPRTVESKIVNWTELLLRRKQWRRQGRTVVWTNGCFDLLHVGHIRSLQDARKLGDVLVVGVNSDKSIRRIKGAPRPLVPAIERMTILAAIEVVDCVVMFEQDTPEAALARLKPEIHCKGADYAPPRGKPVPEAAVVRAYGGRIAFLPLVEKHSTTNLIAQIHMSSRGRVSHA
jgi:D-beta-D-heptose 7-phosphate kinase/D-beta-D-heptose 1-phosphate adenosyltransferase